jgi:hypothetical protein
MSRHIKKSNNGETIAYGFDNVLGYFIDVSKEDENGEDVMILEKCSFLDNMSNGKMLELMESYNLPKEHCTKVAMDLPI